MINQDESQGIVAGTSRVMHEHMSPTAMFTARNGSSGQKQKKVSNTNSFCDFCHMKGHVRSDCCKLMKCDFCQSAISLDMSRKIDIGSLAIQQTLKARREPMLWQGQWQVATICLIMKMQVSRSWCIPNSSWYIHSSSADPLSVISQISISSKGWCHSYVHSKPTSTASPHDQHV